MEITVRKAVKTDFPILRKLYKEAFPPNERKPFFLIKRSAKKGFTEILSICCPECCGMAVTFCFDDIVLLAYFAVSPSQRGGGIGSKAIKEIMKRYRGKRFILEIEDTEVPCGNHEQRVRRKSFYLKNGLKDSQMRVFIFNMEMEILIGGENITFDEYRSIYEKAAGRHFANRIRLLSGKRGR